MNTTQFDVYLLFFFSTVLTIAVVSVLCRLRLLFFSGIVQVPFIVNSLWDALLELDDLTASTNSIMTLLSSLLAYPQVRQCR